MVKLKNITEYEIPRLVQDFNLTDGHAYRTWSPEEAGIIERTSEFFKIAQRQKLPDLEKEYVTQFLTLGRQTIDFTSHTYLQCTSASLGLEIIANYLRLNHLTLSLIEPCFDNLADIFKRHGIPLQPFSDEYFGSPTFGKFLGKIAADAICLVSPNNPTGNFLTKDNFLALLDFCKEKKKLLILDFCFRAYLPEEYIFDQYDLLAASGITYLLIEDTGKTWPTAELKAPFLVVSNAIYQPIYDIYTDMLLHVSPFSLQLMIEFIKNSMQDKLKSVQGVVAINRKVLYENLKGTFLMPKEKLFMSVAWLEIVGMTGFQLKQILDRKDIYILPGDYFYWSNHPKGKYFIRIALVRNSDVFAKAAKILGETCRK